MKVLRTAVAGLGRIGWAFHVPSIARHEGFELVAVSDPMEERLKEASSQYGVRTYTDFNAMINGEKLDLVVIASPTPFHYEQTKAAFEKGIDVFLEKPMVSSLEEADSLIELAKQLGRKLMVYQPRRTDDHVQTLKRILDEGIIGPVYMIKCCHTSDYMRRNDWQALKKYGGGMLNNYGSHFFDQILYLTRSRARSVSCQLRCIASVGDADDVVKALVETENGIIVDMDINRATAFPFPRWLVMGKYGTVRYEEQNGQKLFRIRYLIPEEIPPLELNAEMAAPGRSYDNNDRLVWHEKVVPVTADKDFDYYDYCYSYYAEGHEPFVPVSDTREVMRILEECRKSAGW